MSTKISINGKELSEEEIKILMELIDAGYDSLFVDWNEEEERNYRALVDKYNLNEK